MSSRQLRTSRIASLHPLRPPRIILQAPHSRVFTHNAQLLLLARHTPRPQLPYLSQPALNRARPLNGPSQHLLRLLSTETRSYVKEQTWLAAKWTAIGWTFLVLISISWFGLQLEMTERANRTPEEWPFTVRQCLRAARARMDPENAEKTGYVDWARVGSDLKTALDRLEDTDKLGKGLLEPAEGEEILIPGLGKAGFDISAKSWPWRAGYFEVIMGCGRAAEHLDDMVLDQTRRIVFPKDVVIGPSNPDPRPPPPWMQAAPLEENCVDPYPAPETFYMRVLTGKGFTSKQRIDAALAYANWLNFKRLPESAEEMHKWALDIAAGALSTDVDRGRVIDLDTGALKHGSGAQFVTPNLLRTSTELAIHHARNGNVATALPVLLSVLRARQEAEVVPELYLSHSSSTKSGLGAMLRNIWQPPVFPPPPPSGDDPFVRHSKEASCEESELMLYVGEILFAASPTSSEGAGWTRQAVNIADAHLQREARPLGATGTPSAATKKCKQCLLTGVNNWETMVNRLKDQASAVKEEQRKGWFGSRTRAASEQQTQDLRQDIVRIEELKERIVREDLAEQMARGVGKNPSGVWIG